MDAEFVRPLIEDANIFYNFGWLWGTSGNLSRRLDNDRFSITASGKNKGALTEDDFLELDLEGNILRAKPDQKPSAETSIHQSIYRQLEDVQAIYHVHDPYAALCSNRDHRSGSTELEKWEMIKGLGIWDDDPVSIPIFENHQDVPKIAHDVSRFLDGSKPRVPGVNILRHGLYAWGNSCAEARRHIETFAYLFHVSWESRPRS